jgi:hypothetical protein
MSDKPIFRVIKRSASPALAAIGGLCLGQAIRNAIHHGQAWPLLAGVGAVAFAASIAVYWVPYRIERRKLLRQRDTLLWMQGQMNDMVEHMFETKENDR